MPDNGRNKLFPEPPEGNESSLPELLPPVESKKNKN
jgi:hypothetical protein